MPAFASAPARTILPLIPLVSSTASLMMAITSINNNQCFLRASEDEMPSIALSSYWRYVFPAGVTFVLANGTMSIAGGFVNWRRAVPGGWARWGFGLGLLATATHFVFGPLVAPLIDRMVHVPSTAKQNLRKWLKIHAVRTFVADIPAFIFFFGAALYS